MNTLVTGINYSVDKSRDDTSAAYPTKAVLDLNTADSLPFDGVIVTSPLGWLKQYHQELFHPQLPQHLTKAISEIGYGCLEKVFITFPSAWWDSNDSEQDVRFAFTHFLAPKFGGHYNKERHNIELISLSGLEHSFGHPTLLIYIYGDQAREISSACKSIGENLTSPKSSDGLGKREQYLVNYFMPYFSKMPNYSVESTECTPISAYFTDWLSDPLAGNGSYSNFQISTPELPIEDAVHHVGITTGNKQTSKQKQELDKSIEIIREGLPDSGVWFAGEHTAPFEALGTVTGAWCSGEAVARRISRRYNLSESSKRVI